MRRRLGEAVSNSAMPMFGAVVDVHRLDDSRQGALFALFKRGLLRIEGDLHPFMANLLYIKDVLAAPRRVAR